MGIEEEEEESAMIIEEKVKETGKDGERREKDTEREEDTGLSLDTRLIPCRKCVFLIQLCLQRCIYIEQIQVYRLWCNKD